MIDFFMRFLVLRVAKLGSTHLPISHHLGNGASHLGNATALGAVYPILVAVKKGRVMLNKMCWILLVLLVVGRELTAQQQGPKPKHSGADSVLVLSEEQQMVYMLLQERAAYQALSLQRQRRFIYGLGVLSVLLIGATVLLVRNNRQRRLANHLLSLKSLLSQMNPHFIFNSLNSVNGFISGNNVREANKYLADFSHLMRIVLDNSAQDFVPLDVEIAALRLYLSLEHLRFRDLFEVEFTVDPAITPHLHRIPPMLVQPYIENAIWHGLRYKQAPGQLWVSITQEEAYLVLRVADDGIGRQHSQQLKTAQQKSHRSLGMQNTHERITLLHRIYGQPITLQVSDLSAGEYPGTEVLIRIPKALTEEMS
ncbi:MAG TPA: hypothetical protein DCE41_01390 [Cytophagales bacterium]|nr:hypothetical protein [Cytophagales bacterium]